MPRNLFIDELQSAFRNHAAFTTVEVRGFYQHHVPGIINSTVNWKIYHLIEAGVIIRIQRGVYRLNA